MIGAGINVVAVDGGIVGSTMIDSPHVGTDIRVTALDAFADVTASLVACLATCLITCRCSLASASFLALAARARIASALHNFAASGSPM